MRAVYTDGQSQALSDSDRRMLEQGSAIAPEVLAESGARSITRGSELPKVFSRRQRERAPGVLFNVDRPNGGRSYSWRPDTVDPDNPGHKYEQPPKKRGGAGNVLHVLPSQRHLVGDTSVPVVFVEGTKKMLSLVSAAREAGEDVLVVGIVGVWNWLHDGGKPIEDMTDIPLKGRKATVMFDSDVLRKWQVGLAAERLAEYLQGRGAAGVFVTYFHDMPDGSKCGADDFLASGGTFGEIRMLTRRYDREDFVRLRLERDEDLRRALAEVQRRFWNERWKGQSEHSARDTCHALIEAARSRGRVLADGTLEVPISWGALQLAAGNISSRTMAKAIAYLQSESVGIILRRIKPQNARKSGSFVLATGTRAKVKHNRAEGNPTTESNDAVTSLYARTLLSRAPRMMWSSPGYKGRRGTAKGTRRVRQSPPPKPRPARRRPGKVRSHVTDALEHAGGAMEKADLAACLGIAPGRERELTRRKRTEKGRDGLLIWYIDSGIITLEDGVVSLTADYLERIEDERLAGGEIEAFEYAAARLKIRRDEYRDYLARGEARGQSARRTSSKPSGAGLANIAESRRKREEHLKRETEEPRVRTNEQERRIAQMVREGMKRRFAEEEVYRRSKPKSKPSPEPEPRRSQHKMPPKIDGIYQHGQECGCWICGDDLDVGFDEAAEDHTAA